MKTTKKRSSKTSAKTYKAAPKGRAGKKREGTSATRKGTTLIRSKKAARGVTTRDMPEASHDGSEAAAAQGVTIRLRNQGGEILSFESSGELKQAAMQWSYVLCNRRRWNTSDATREDQARRAREQLEKLHITKEKLREIAESDVVEVSVPYRAEKEGWEARIFPWEYMLSAATRPFRAGKSLTVLRHLDKQNQPAASHRGKKERLLFVESAPRELRETYNFDSERNLVKTGLGLKKIEMSVDETRQKLRERVEGYEPDIVHLAGFDNNQAVALGVLKTSAVRDGFLMKGNPEGVDPDPVEARDLVKIINGAEHKPVLVGCNLYYSAARICSLMVAHGSGACIGFQDEFDDTLTELFFTNFYDAWRQFNWDTLEAFKFACNLIKGQPQALTGTGVVLWSEHSLVKPQSVASREIKTTLLSEKEKDITLAELTDKDLRKLISVEVKTCPNLNYSMLHNNCELFEKFILRKEKTGRLKDIRIDVVLYVGGESSRYSCSVDMVESPLDLNKMIRVPLIYSIELLNNENIHTGLFVEVSWENQLLHRQTYRVTLPPLDEWRGNDVERVWLPSFVLPRDPAINKIVDIGQTYVMALRDDSRAGFDGYQCIPPPHVDAENPVECVDQQVRALWAALIYNLSISYINPPPTYNLTAQRLRTPSEVVNGRRGTCIDLALMFAACLEYVDIYPVIFLFKNHALPGFWRNSQFQYEFKGIAERFKTTLPQTGEEKADVSTVQEWPWYHSKNAYDEIMQEVEADRLYPIETIGITQRASYQDSVREGINKLENKGQLDALTFEGMIDITQARDSLITPLPRR